MDVLLLFTISEETGVGASHVLHGDVAELIAVDNGTIAPDQNTSEYGVTIAMQDSSGPFDYYLTRRLSGLCDTFGIEHSRDVFQKVVREAGGGEITTEILPAPPFFYAEDYHQQYLDKVPNGYCGLGGTGLRYPAEASVD